MIKKRFYVLWVMLCVSFFANAKLGPTNKLDNSPAGKIKRDIDTLIAERMDGRLTGSDGEFLAAKYIQSRFQQLQLSPFMGNYIHEFTAIGGNRIAKNAYFKLFDKKMMIGSEVIFLPFGDGNSISGFAYPEVYEENNVWLVSLNKIKQFDNFNPQKSIYEFAKNAVLKNASAIVFINDYGTTVDLNENNLGKFESVPIPIAYLNHKAYLNYIKPNLKKDWIEVDAKLGYEEAKSTGKNVVAFMNNKALHTIVVAAHYDNIGNTNSEKYEGANSNASGIAGLLNVAEQIISSNNKLYNYLFIAFSGKEQNLQGSKSFLKQNDNYLNSISCMINLDMIGQLNSKKQLFVNGIGTSLYWMQTLTKSNTTLLSLQIDSSGYGYSDYTSFYTKNIPILGVSTGYFDGYLSSEDVLKKVSINSIVEVSNFVVRTITEVNKLPKFNFQKTNDFVPQIQKLKVDVGVIFDNSYNENGVRVDGVIPFKLAHKTGLQHGDIITKVGEQEVIDMEDYLNGIKHASKEKETVFVVKRDGIDLKFFMLLKE